VLPGQPWTSPQRTSASPAMQAVLETLSRVADRDVPVLLHGEGGSGKSRLALLVHGLSPRRAGPFVRVDCVDLAGAAEAARSGTGASPAPSLQGRLREAAGGTLFLREVGALPARLQSALLLHVRPGRAGAAARARIVATTQRDLLVDVAAGRFLEDLLFRLGVIEVEVPPLRRRPEDVPALARSFLETFARAEGVDPPRLTERAARALSAYSWPGNIRELRNVMQRGLVLCRDACLDLDALPDRVAAAAGQA